jgi:hypothetical protein
MMASPRPNTSGGKTIPKQSPAAATKTPASTHGHFPGLSASSQPSSTPLAAANIHDELLNLNSPAAALINSIAQNGLTPLGGGQDGLGISTQGQIGTGRDGQIARTPAEERLHQLEGAIERLKGKVIGRGVTREGIERVARLHGFEALWDEDNLVIAGKMVEIEITFAAIPRDAVRDLSFKLNYDDEQHTQYDGTAMLKNQAGVKTNDSEQQVTDLTNFANNVQYLAQLDSIDSKPNTFQLVDNLYHTFQDIWKEEKKRMQWRNSLQHMRQGSLGVPNMNRAPELGLTFGYWRPDRILRDVDGRTSEGTPPDLGDANDFWTAKVSCETGLPFLNASQNWVSSKILTEGQPGQNVLDAGDSIPKPDWRDYSIGGGVKDSGTDAEKSSSGLTQPLQAHFVCELRPEVYLPYNAVVRFNTEVHMVDIDARKATSYSIALQKARNTKLGRPEDSAVESRWSRKLPVVDQAGKLSFSEQSYALYSSSQENGLWCYPVTRVRFNHPRQLAEVLPTLRQYAAIWSMLKALVLQPSPSSNTADSAKAKNAKGVTRRSNRPLQNGSSHGEVGANILNVDVTLDVLSDAPKARLDVIAPLRTHSGAKMQESILHWSISVSPGGSIQVTAVDGIHDKDQSGLKVKLSKMLSATQDPGIVLHWLLDRAMKQS